MQGEPLHQTALHASARALLQAPQSPTRGASALQQLVQAREATGRGGAASTAQGTQQALGALAGAKDPVSASPCGPRRRSHHRGLPGRPLQQRHWEI